MTVAAGRTLMRGSEAVARGALLAGCRHFYGYPITPSSEIMEHLAAALPAAGGVFLQAESEVAAINMVIGAAAAGQRAMTATSGNGYSLMLEGISAIAAYELPAVLVLAMRNGPGIGSIDSSQLDYFSVTKGGGHGGYRSIVLAPSSVEEIVGLTQLAFHLADRHRMLAVVLIEGYLAGLAEAATYRPLDISGLASLPAKTWALTGKRGRARNTLDSAHLGPDPMRRFHARLEEKYARAWQEARAEAMLCDDAEIVVVAFGFTARIAQAAVKRARVEGIPAGLVRPITLWPFPSEAIERACRHAGAVLVVEQNAGQMVEDVRLTLGGGRPVRFIGRCGGCFDAEEIAEAIRWLLKRDSTP